MTRIGSSSRADRAYYRRVATWMAEVAEALDYAHEQGVIHRDIKPSNLLLSTGGRLMISDFGLARATGVESLTVSHSLLGTCRYMSPEQVDEKAEPLDRRADVYALGATMYELLAFRPMFAAADDREVLNQVLNKDPTPPHKFVRQVPRELETICRKAVEKERANRYETAKDMADDLNRWLLDLPIHAKRPSLPARAQKFVRRRKLPVALGMTAVVLFVAAGLLYAGYRGSQRDAAAAMQLAGFKDVQLVVYEVQREFENGRHEAGLQRLEDALAEHPDEIKLQINRARLLNHLQRHQEAAGYVKGIIARDPNCWEAHFELAMIYRTMKEDPEKVAYHAGRAEALMPPETAWTYYVRALGEGDLRKAIELASEAIEFDPTDIGPVLLRCQLHRNLRQYDKMLEDAERAVAMRPRWAITHGQRGQALLNLGRYEEAERGLSRAIELDAGWVQWWNNRAEVRYKLKRFAEAAADVEKALKINPELARTRALRGSVRAALGDLDGCLADFERAIESSPQDAMLYIRRASILVRAERWDAAIRDAARAIELEPDNADFHYNLGAVRLRVHQYAEAIPAFDRAIELAPDQLVSMRARAMAFIQVLRFDEAVADLTLALEREPRNVLVLVQRGLACELAGRDDDAIADYQRAAVLDDPGRSYAKLWWYILLRQGGQEQAAAKILTSQTSAETGQCWVDALFDFFAGERSSEELLAAAANESEHCEAYYYLARKALLEGRTDTAKGAFAQCLALDEPRRGVMEADFARARLTQMEEGPTASP